ncbi:Aste57867_24218 [Aphanomyces stellatus]|uniref:Aste57867_24218 protein n=1 Tax=Aphanomyces stellatus TaxID=120398 RepID=A0A485LQ24_9STRA|nr:hypothetical protein As57867_024143 [Aphanomyces stellatus]VFU00859.1 Aste57867_24218 [Aphanomyces stellatus]
MGFLNSWKSFRYSITGGSRRTSISSQHEAGVIVQAEKTASYVALGRVTSNVVAAMIIFLPMVTLIVLISQGMFDRLIISVNTQTAALYWADLAKSCVLSSTGWVANSCDATTLAVMPLPAFTAIGTAMAQQLAAEMKEGGGTLKMTTCYIGGTADVGWANLQFIAGYDYYPDCLPAAPQDIAGIAMLETTVWRFEMVTSPRSTSQIRDNHADGLYFLTLYSDLDPAMTVYSYANSDGTLQNLMANPKRTLFTATGDVETDTLGGDYIIFSRPLGERYRVMGYCVTEIEELSQVNIDQGLSGWSQGKHSKHAVAPGWACGHKVQNSGELIAMQIFFIVGTLVLFAGDVFVTFEGFRGVMQGKPVLTYTILAGLERRKLLVAFIVCNAMPGLLYADVSRIYYFTKNGFKIWCLSCIMVANFFTFALILGVSILDMIPLRLPQVVSYHAPIYLYSSIAAITISCCKNSIYQYAYNMFYAASPFVTLHINDADWPSGSYTSVGTPMALEYLKDAVVQPLLVTFACAIVISTLIRVLKYKSVLMSLHWCKTNSFLTHAVVPNFITSLPLEQSNAIKIGNKMYCKPSTQALMGYATVVEKASGTAATSTKADDEKKKPTAPPNFVISIYALVPAMFVLPHAFKQFGKIEHNQFTPSTKANLEKRRYKHTRGACVV